MGLLIVVLVTAASLQDRDGGRRILDRARMAMPSIALVLADGGYAGKLVAWVARYCRIVLEIVQKPEGQRTFEVLPRRWVVERTLSWLMRWRRLVISDGAAGLIGALERTMGAALRQRCLVQRARNVLAKVPKNAQTQVKADYWAIFDVPDTIEPGLDAVGYVQKRIDSFEKRWRDAYPAAVRCLLEDRDSLTVYLRFPREHWTRVRHSNFIVVWSPPGSVFDVRHAALRCLVVRGGRGYLQSSRRQSLRRDDAGCTGHLTGLVA